MPQEPTLAQRIRTKYPGAYDDLDDAALEAAILAKYPGVYDNLPRTTTSAPTSTPTATDSLSLGPLMPFGVDTAQDLVIGAGKRLAGMGLGATELINKGTAALGLSDPIAPQVFDRARSAIAPTNTAQTIGGVATDIGTAFVPAGAVTRGAKAAAMMAPRFTRALTRGAVEGAGAAGLAAAQGYDPTVAGVVGGTLGTVSGAASSVARRLKSSADDSMLAALGPAGRGTGPVGTNQVEMGKKVAPELLRRGFRATSHEDALSKIGDAITKADEAIDAAMGSIAPAGTQVKLKTGPIIAALLKSKEAGQVAGIDVGTGKIANAVIDDVIADIRKIGPSMTPEQAVKLRQKIGPLAKFSQLATASENVKAEAYKDVYHGIRSAIETLSPNIRGANKEMSFWLNVRDLIERSSRRPQPPSSGTSGAVIGAVTGSTGGVASALTLAAIGRQLQRLTRSPGWRFTSAQVKDKLADAIAKGDLGRFNQLVATVAGGAAN